MKNKEAIKNGFVDHASQTIEAFFPIPDKQNRSAKTVPNKDQELPNLADFVKKSLFIIDPALDLDKPITDKDLATQFSKARLFYLYKNLGLEDFFDPSLTVKEIEGKLVYQLMDFDNSPDFNRNDKFIVTLDTTNLNTNDSKEMAEFEESLDGELERLFGRFEEHFKNNEIMHVRFRMNDGRSSGNPVTYIRSSDELKEVYDSNEKFFTSNGGEKILLSQVSEIDIFYQQAAEKKMVDGFANKTGEQLVALGGGIRLEFDTIRDGKFIFTASSSWNDVGPRSTSREGSFNAKQPFFQTQIAVSLAENGAFIFHNQSASQAADSPKIEHYLNEVLAEIFAKNGKQIASLFLALNNVDPAVRKHSLEAAVSLCKSDSKSKLLQLFINLFKRKQRKLEWKFKITSFDGLCTAFDTVVEGKDEGHDDQILSVLEKGETAPNTLLRGKFTHILDEKIGGLFDLRVRVQEYNKAINDRILAAEKSKELLFLQLNFAKNLSISPNDEPDTENFAPLAKSNDWVSASVVKQLQEYLKNSDFMVEKQFSEQLLKDYISSFKNSLMDLMSFDSFQQSSASFFGEMLKQLKLVTNSSSWKLTEAVSLESGIEEKDYCLKIFDAGSSKDNKSVQIFYLESKGVPFACIIEDGKLVSSGAKNIRDDFSFYRQFLMAYNPNLPKLDPSYFSYHD